MEEYAKYEEYAHHTYVTEKLSEADKAAEIPNIYTNPNIEY